MKIKNIIKVGKHKVYDLSIEDVEHYVLENGVVTHNTGMIYASNTIWQIGKRQIKEGKEVIGYDFMINIDKSRYLKEKAVIPLNVTYSGGINVWGGLMDVAVLGGFVTKPSNGWYVRPHIKDDKKSRLNDTNCEEFWKPVLEDTEFPEFIERVYKLATTKLIQDEVDETGKPIEFDPETGEVIEDK